MERGVVGWQGGRCQATHPPTKAATCSRPAVAATCAAQVEEIYSRVRKTHNAGVFDAYTDEMRAARKSGVLSGLPDGYGRGRIIGDYRRVALYGVDALIAAKKKDLKFNLVGVMDEEKIRLREEVNEQMRALNELKEMAKSYGFDVSKPATNSREAVQFVYFAYLVSGGGALQQRSLARACMHAGLRPPCLLIYVACVCLVALQRLARVLASMSKAQGRHPCHGLKACHAYMPAPPPPPSGRRQGAGRRRDVAGPRGRVPRHLL